MAEPNLPGAVYLHAGAFVDSGGVPGAGAANISGVVRNGVGDYTVTLGTDIDITNRTVKLTLKNAAGEISVGAEDDMSVQVLAFDSGGVAADRDFYIEVTRRTIGTN